MTEFFGYLKKIKRVPLLQFYLQSVKSKTIDKFDVLFVLLLDFIIIALNVIVVSGTPDEKPKSLLQNIIFNSNCDERIVVLYYVQQSLVNPNESRKKRSRSDYL